MLYCIGIHARGLRYRSARASDQCDFAETLQIQNMYSTQKNSEFLPFGTNYIWLDTTWFVNYLCLDTLSCIDDGYNMRCMNIYLHNAFSNINVSHPYVVK